MFRSLVTERARSRRKTNWLGVERLEDRLAPAVANLQGALGFPSLTVNPDAYDASRILVRFRPGAAADQHIQWGTALGPEVSLIPGLHEVWLSPDTSVEAALQAYRQDSRVLYAEPDYRVQLSLTPNDPQFTGLWGLNNTGQTGGVADADVDAPEAWDVTTGSPSMVVAVIDTGVDYTHPDLAANMWVNPGELPNNRIDDDGNGFIDDVHGYDFVNNDGDPQDDFFHGTHVAGTIGALGNNGIGVTGLNWQVQIMALKFLDSNGSGSTADAVRALNYAVANGATISNNSWGGGPFSQALYDAIANAGSAGHIFVAAAGNDGSNNDLFPFYPAGYDLPNVIAVAATTHTDGLASFSNYGARTVDLGAPGENILSTLPTFSTPAMGSYGLPTYYGTISGTSMATPHVAGVVALVWGHSPGLTSTEVINQVLATVDVMPSLQQTVTGGRLNAAAAMGNLPPPPPDTSGPRVTFATPSGAVVGAVSSIRVRFNEAVAVSTFTATDLVSFTGPNGAIDLSQLTVALVPFSNDREFDIAFPTETTEGAYSLVFGPDLTDLAGNLMNQDNDAVNGEDPEDRYTAGFAITAGLVFHSSDVPAPIYDFNITVSYLDIPVDVTIGDLDVQLSISHTYVGDLAIYLIAPTGEFVLLSYFNGAGADFAGTIFDDEAPLPISFGAPPFAGSYQPDEPLSLFDGLSSQGTWALWIEDWGFFDEGFLTAWSISLNSGGGGDPPPPPPPPDNLPPSAGDDYVSTPEDASVVIAVLDNDSDPDGDRLTVTGVAGVTDGTALINADNTITFTPNANFYGTTYFTYSISDGRGSTASAWVTVNVWPVNDPPVAVDDQVTAAQDTPVRFNDPYTASYYLASNDLDPDGDQLWVIALSNAVHGSVDIDPYTSAIVFTPEAGYRGIASFEYTVTDGFKTDVGLVTIEFVGLYYLSTAESGTLTNSDGSTLSFSDADILQLQVDGAGGYTYRMYFDGSDVGLGAAGEDIDAFALLPNGGIVISTVGNFSISQPGETIVGDGADLLFFYPDSLGATTAGSWFFYFDGSDVGLNAGPGNIDAVAQLNDGRILISTSGNLTVDGIAVSDADLLAFHPVYLGSVTSGSWEHYFDGSDVGLSGSSEDIDALYVRESSTPGADPILYFSTRGVFSVPELEGQNEDVFPFTPTQLGATTTGSYGPGLTLLGSAYGLGAFNVDGFHLGIPPGGIISGGSAAGGLSAGSARAAGGSPVTAAVDRVFAAGFLQRLAWFPDY